MKITRVTTHVCNADMRNWVFVRVETDQPGLFGWGEATLEWKTRAVVGAVEDVAQLLIGSDPRDIEQCLQIMTRHGFWRMGIIGMSAISGIEIALWDILGKELSVPVWRLLGGKVREGLRVYTHLGMGDMQSVYETQTVEAIAERGRQVVAAGYDAVKVVSVPYSHYLATNKQVDVVAAMMAALREAVGPEVDIMVDMHGRPPSTAAAFDYLRAMEPARLLFAEEPVPPEDMRGLAEVRGRSGIAIAAGERLVGRREFVPALEMRAFDIAQPDLCHVGGLWEARKIAALAESAGIGVAPHNPLGPIAGVAALHFGVSTPNVVIQEEMTGAVEWYDDVVDWPIERKAGRWDVPSKPGLGIEVRENVIASHPFRAETLHARNAVLADGTIADW